MLRGKGLRAAAVVLGALIFVPAAFAHHPVVTASFSCDGVVSYTATAWATNSGLPGSRTNTDVRVFETKIDSTTLNPAVQVGSGAFTQSNNYTFSGSFTVASTVNSVTLNAKEFVRWGDGAGQSGGTNAESTATARRATTGCTPPPHDVCPNIPGTQTTVPTGMITDGSGNCVTPPPPPTDVCPNISGVQPTVPAGMVTDGSGNCVTPPPPPPPPPTDVCPNLDGAQGVVPDGMVVDASGNCVTPAPPPPSVTPTSVTPKATPQPVVKHAKKKLVKKVVKKHVKKHAKKHVKHVKKHPKKTHAKATQVRRPGVLPFTP